MTKETRRKKQRLIDENQELLKQRELDQFSEYFDSAFDRYFKATSRHHPTSTATPERLKQLWKEEPADVKRYYIKLAIKFSSNSTEAAAGVTTRSKSTATPVDDLKDVENTSACHLDLLDKGAGSSSSSSSSRAAAFSLIKSLARDSSMVSHFGARPLKKARPAKPTTSTVMTLPEKRGVSAPPEQLLIEQRQQHYKQVLSPVRTHGDHLIQDSARDNGNEAVEIVSPTPRRGRASFFNLLLEEGYTSSSLTSFTPVSSSTAVKKSSLVPTPVSAAPMQMIIPPTPPNSRAAFTVSTTTTTTTTPNSYLNNQAALSRARTPGPNLSVNVEHSKHQQNHQLVSPEPTPTLPPTPSSRSISPSINAGILAAVSRERRKGEQLQQQQQQQRQQQQLKSQQQQLKSQQQQLQRQRQKRHRQQQQQIQLQQQVELAQIEEHQDSTRLFPPQQQEEYHQQQQHNTTTTSTLSNTQEWLEDGLGGDFLGFRSSPATRSDLQNYSPYMSATALIIPQASPTQSFLEMLMIDGRSSPCPSVINTNVASSSTATHNNHVGQRSASAPPLQTTFSSTSSFASPKFYLPPYAIPSDQIDYNSLYNFFMSPAHDPSSDLFISDLPQQYHDYQ